jgi:hypothetical protein
MCTHLGDRDFTARIVLNTTLICDPCVATIGAKHPDLAFVKVVPHPTFIEAPVISPLLLENDKFLCKGCGRAFACRSNLNRHTKQFHSPPPVVLAIPWPNTASSDLYSDGQNPEQGTDVSSSASRFSSSGLPTACLSPQPDVEIGRLPPMGTDFPL